MFRSSQLLLYQERREASDYLLFMEGEGNRPACEMPTKGSLEAGTRVKVKGGWFLAEDRPFRTGETAPSDGDPKAPSTTQLGKGAPGCGSTTCGPFPCEAKRSEERETERESHFGSSRPAAVLLVRGALGDGPPGGQRVVSASLAGGRYPEWGEA